jgi:hypothetical protein
MKFPTIVFLIFFVCSSVSSASFTEHKHEKSSSGNFSYSISVDWNERSVKWPIEGEYDTRRHYLIVRNKKGEEVKKIKDVPFAIWVSNDRLLYFVGVSLEACPDYFVQSMHLIDFLSNETKSIKKDLFCGRSPVIKEDWVEFPCCNSQPSSKVLFSNI